MTITKTELDATKTELDATKTELDAKIKSLFNKETAISAQDITGLFFDCIRYMAANKEAGQVTAADDWAALSETLNARALDPLTPTHINRAQEIEAITHALFGSMSLTDAQALSVYNLNADSNSNFKNNLLTINNLLLGILTNYTPCAYDTSKDIEPMLLAKMEQTSTRIINNRAQAIKMCEILRKINTQKLNTSQLLQEIMQLEASMKLYAHNTYPGTRFDGEMRNKIFTEATLDLKFSKKTDATTLKALKELAIKISEITSNDVIIDHNLQLNNEDIANDSDISRVQNFAYVTLDIVEKSINAVAPDSPDIKPSRARVSLHDEDVRQYLEQNQEFKSFKSIWIKQDTHYAKEKTTRKSCFTTKTRNARATKIQKLDQHIQWLEQNPSMSLHLEATPKIIKSNSKWRMPKVHACIKEANALREQWLDKITIPTAAGENCVPSESEIINFRVQYNRAMRRLRQQLRPNRYNLNRVLVYRGELTKIRSQVEQYFAQSPSASNELYTQAVKECYANRNHSFNSNQFKKSIVEKSPEGSWAKAKATEQEPLEQALLTCLAETQYKIPSLISMLVNAQQQTLSRTDKINEDVATLLYNLEMFIGKDFKFGSDPKSVFNKIFFTTTTEIESVRRTNNSDQVAMDQLLMSMRKLHSDPNFTIDLDEYQNKFMELDLHWNVMRNSQSALQYPEDMDQLNNIATKYHTWAGQMIPAIETRCAINSGQNLLKNQYAAETAKIDSAITSIQNNNKQQFIQKCDEIQKSISKKIDLLEQHKRSLVQRKPNGYIAQVAHSTQAAYMLRTFSMKLKEDMFSAQLDIKKHHTETTSESPASQRQHTDSPDSVATGSFDPNEKKQPAIKTQVLSTDTGNAIKKALENLSNPDEFLKQLQQASPDSSTFRLADLKTFCIDLQQLLESSLELKFGLRLPIQAVLNIQGEYKRTKEKFKHDTNIKALIDALLLPLSEKCYGNLTYMQKPVFYAFKIALPFTKNLQKYGHDSNQFGNNLLDSTIGKAKQDNAAIVSKIIQALKGVKDKIDVIDAKEKEKTAAVSKAKRKAAVTAAAHPKVSRPAVAKTVNTKQQAATHQAPGETAKTSKPPPGSVSGSGALPTAASKTPRQPVAQKKVASWQKNPVKYGIAATAAVIGICRYTTSIHALSSLVHLHPLATASVLGVCAAGLFARKSTGNKPESNAAKTATPTKR